MSGQPPEWVGSLPDDLKGNEVLVGIPDVPTLAKNFLETKNAPWNSSLPEDMRGIPQVTRYKDLPSFVKGHLELEKKLGAGRVSIPTENAPPEEWDSFYKLLGRPEKPEDYKVDRSNDVEMSEDVEKNLRTQAHRMNLSPRQTQQLFDAYGNELKEAMKVRSENLKMAEEMMQERYGANYTRNIAIAQRALAHIDDEEKTLKTLLDDTGIGNHPAMVELFRMVGDRMVEDGLIPGDVEGTTGREDALEQIKAMEADPKHPYHTSKAGDEIHTKFTKLFQIAYPDK